MLKRYKFFTSVISAVFLLLFIFPITPIFAQTCSGAGTCAVREWTCQLGNIRHTAPCFDASICCVSLGTQTDNSACQFWTGQGNSKVCTACVLKDQICVSDGIAYCAVEPDAISSGVCPDTEEKECSNGCRTTPACNTGITCSGCGGPVANTCYAGNSTGTNCQFTALIGGGTCIPAAAPNQGGWCTINNCFAGFTCGGGNCLTTIHGRVWLDYNQNGNFDGIDSAVPNYQVRLSTGATVNTDGNGNYTFTGVRVGTYTVSITRPASPPTIGDITKNVTINNGTPNPTVNFNITPVYTIAGNIYDDNNQNQLYDPTNPDPKSQDTLDTHNATITFAGPTNTSAATTTGPYTSPLTLLAGSYTVSYGPPPSGYYMTYPLNGVPASFIVTVGPGCTTSANSASCSNNNIINLNFGISNSPGWIQSACGDIRGNGGITNIIPPNPSCGSYSGAYMIRNDATACNTGGPGVAFTGSTNAYYGQGQAAPNPYNWTAGGTAYPESLQTPTLQELKTSYNSLTALVRQAGTPTIPMPCTLNNCSLPPGLTHGLFTANGSVTFNAYTFRTPPPNQNYVFLINGDLTINGNIQVPVGDTVLFSVSGNIYVNSNVGTTPATSTVSNIDGFYSTDKSFIINSAGVCSDQKLNIAGSVIVNAALKGGSFQNNRNLCSTNLSCPTVLLSQRPDLILNAPAFIKSSSHVWQEVLPGTSPAPFPTTIPSPTLPGGATPSTTLPPGVTLTNTPTPTLSPTPMPTATPTSSPTPKPTATPKPTPSPTPTPDPCSTWHSGSTCGWYSDGHGLYCGQNPACGIGGNGSTLYTCQHNFTTGQTWTTKSQFCSNGCHIATSASQDDKCN